MRQVHAAPRLKLGDLLQRFGGERPVTDPAAYVVEQAGPVDGERQHAVGHELFARVRLGHQWRAAERAALGEIRGLRPRLAARAREHGRPGVRDPPAPAANQLVVRMPPDRRRRTGDRGFVSAMRAAQDRRAGCEFEIGAATRARVGEHRPTLATRDNAVAVSQVDRATVTRAVTQIRPLLARRGFAYAAAEASSYVWTPPRSAYAARGQDASSSGPGVSCPRPRRIAISTGE